MVNKNALGDSDSFETDPLSIFGIISGTGLGNQNVSSLSLDKDAPIGSSLENSYHSDLSKELHEIIAHLSPFSEFSDIDTSVYVPEESEEKTIEDLVKTTVHPNTSNETSKKNDIDTSVYVPDESREETKEDIDKTAVIPISSGEISKKDDIDASVYVSDESKEESRKDLDKTVVIPSSLTETSYKDDIDVSVYVSDESKEETRRDLDKTVVIPSSLTETSYKDDIDVSVYVPDESREETKEDIDKTAVIPISSGEISKKDDIDASVYVSDESKEESRKDLDKTVVIPSSLTETSYKDDIDVSVYVSDESKEETKEDINKTKIVDIFNTDAKISKDDINTSVYISNQFRDESRRDLDNTADFSNLNIQTLMELTTDKAPALIVNSYLLSILEKYNFEDTDTRQIFIHEWSFLKKKSEENNLNLSDEVITQQTFNEIRNLFKDCLKLPVIELKADQSEPFSQLAKAEAEFVKDKLNLIDLLKNKQTALQKMTLFERFCFSKIKTETKVLEIEKISKALSKVSCKDDLIKFSNNLLDNKNLTEHRSFQFFSSKKPTNTRLQLMQYVEKVKLSNTIA